MVGLRIRRTQARDSAALLELYRAVARVPGGLARTAQEITPEYVAQFTAGSQAAGVAFVAQGEGDALLGEIHASALGPAVFTHVLGDLTVVVDPKAQGAGVGRALFEALLLAVRNERPDILRVELIARESNARAIVFYESLGFRREGRFEGRIASVGGGFEADIPMAWRR